MYLYMISYNVGRYTYLYLQKIYYSISLFFLIVKSYIQTRQTANSKLRNMLHVNAVYRER